MASSYSSIKKSLLAKKQETRLKAVPKCFDLPSESAFKLLSLGMAHWDRRIRHASAEAAADLFGAEAGPHIADLITKREIGIGFGIKLLEKCECEESYSILDALIKHKRHDISSNAKETLLKFNNLPLNYFLKYETGVDIIFRRIKVLSAVEIIKALKRLDLYKRYKLIKKSGLSSIFVSEEHTQEFDKLLIETVLDYCASERCIDRFSKGRLDRFEAAALNEIILAFPINKRKDILKTWSIREYFNNRHMSNVFSIVEAKSEEAKSHETFKPFHPKIVEILPVSEKTLWWLFRQIEKGNQLYHQTEIEKRSGGTRIISSPHPALKYVQRMIYENILAPQQLNDAAHGFRKEHSTVTNAVNHIGSKIIMTLDLKDFFPSISANRVYGIFAGLDFSGDDASFLTDLCVEKGCLPQGAPTSPVLANLACRRLDSRLVGLACSINAVYSRYADDLTFSGDDRIISALPLIKKIITQEGLIPADHKLRIMRRGNRQEVTGLTVNDKLTVPRPHRRKIRAMLHDYAKGEKIYWNGQEIGKRELVGHLSYLSAVQPELAKSWLEKYSLH